MGNKYAPIEKTMQKGGLYKVNGFDHISAKVDALY